MDITTFLLEKNIIIENEIGDVIRETCKTTVHIPVVKLARLLEEFSRVNKGINKPIIYKPQ